MIDLSDRADGIVVPVRAQPRARKTAIVGEHAGALKIAVTAPPEDGKANDAIALLLSESLRLKRSQIELISGAASRNKKFIVRGLAKAELAARIASLVAN